MEQELREWVDIRFEKEVPPALIEEQQKITKEQVERLLNRQREMEKLVWAWKSPPDCLRVP
jgi:hypothetical protein